MSQAVTAGNSRAHAQWGPKWGPGAGGGPVAKEILTHRFVTTVTEPGKYNDGGGLLLRVRQRTDDIERTWAFRYRLGKAGSLGERWIGLGTVRDVSLAAARDAAKACREALARGEDPRTAATTSREAAPTFGVVADQLIASLSSGFKNPITVKNWERTLGDSYCGAIRSKPVDQVTTDDVVGVLSPIWQLKAETAKSVQERIERVLDAAKVRGLRDGQNPAQWKGHLKLILPPQRAKKGHHRALPWAELPGLLARLRADRESVSAMALEWTILTCARTAMTIDCPVAEIDRQARVWVIPAERMKEDKELRIPLVPRCIEIFDEMRSFGSTYLFPGRDPREPMSNMAMAECLRQFKVDATVHGMRSTFSDWGHDATDFDSELIEQALAHATGNAVKRAYRRGDALDRRRELMQAWSDYCLCMVPA